MIDSFPILSALIWLPIVGGLGVLALEGPKKYCSARLLSLVIAVICFSLCIPLLLQFDSQLWQMQMVERHTWLPGLGIDYALGVDGFSLPLIALTCFMTIIVVIASKRSVKDRVAQYLAAFLIMQGLMCGVFESLDAILFYIFFEAMLIPMFLIIGIWGGPNRIYATIKFFLYTFLGSVFLLIALIYLSFQAKTAGYTGSEVFTIQTFHLLNVGLEQQKWLFFAFLIAFAVKVPMWPVHTWLPDAHVEAPTGGSVILAAITLKMGGYGFLRFILPILPEASAYYASFIITLSLIAIIYIGLVAIVQQDMKKLIAYSSISHMGFVTLGCFVVFAMVTQDNRFSEATMGIEGAMVMMISHGFISGALFLCIGVLYDRVHSRQIKDYGGVVNKMPIFASFFMLFAMANSGLPGTAGFIGEFFVLLTAFQANIWYAILGGLTLILGATYTLWMYKRVVFGNIGSPAVAALEDIDKREIFVFVLLGAAVLFFGLWPAPLLKIMHTSVDHLVYQMALLK